MRTYASYLWTGYRRAWRHCAVPRDRVFVAFCVVVYPALLATFMCMPSWREQARAGHKPWI